MTTYDIIEKALYYIHHETEGDHPVNWTDVANHVHCSESHFNRLFKEWAGISPDRFIRYQKKERLKAILDQSHSLLEATYNAGFSSSSRVHDLMVTYEAMTPAQYRSRGEGLRIDYGFHDTPYGCCFLAATPRGIVELSFHDSPNEHCVNAFKHTLPNATFRQNTYATAPLIHAIFSPASQQEPIHLLLRGTNFQIKVWEALLRIPKGALVAYNDIAQAIQSPKAHRAVGTAVGRNNISYLIPCHRVIQKVGTMGNYRWGIFRKQAMIGKEIQP